MIELGDIVILKQDFVLTSSLVEPIIVGRKNQKCEIVSIDKDFNFSEKGKSYAIMIGDEFYVFFEKSEKLKYSDYFYGKEEYRQLKLDTIL